MNLVSVGGAISAMIGSENNSGVLTLRQSPSSCDHTLKRLSL